MIQGPLNGMRVVDVSQAHSGPFATMLLADLGAEVIKVEPPVVGDLQRQGPSPRLNGVNYYMTNLHRNKKGITLDLRVESGKAAFLDLVKISDVVLDNFRPGAMERMGLDYEALKKVNHGIITCSLTGYGSSGPYAKRAGYDVNALAISGMLSLIGEPGRMPVRPGIALGDISGGIFAAIGVMSAWYARKRTGAGDQVDVSLLDSCLYLMNTYFTHYALSGEVPGPQGGRHLTEVPAGIYKAKDAYIAMGNCWPGIARALGLGHLADNPGFGDPNERLKHRKELEEAIEAALREVPTTDCLDMMKAQDVPAAPIQNLEQTVNDPQVVHNGSIIDVYDDNRQDKAMVVACPIRMEGKSRGEYRRAPKLGEHTHELLRDLLGYPEEKIRKMDEEAEKHAEATRAHVRRVVM